MASFLALRSLLSKSVCPKLRALATAPSLSRSFNTNALVRDSDDGERGYAVDRRRDDFAPSSFPGTDVYDPFSPPRSLSQVLNLMDRIMDSPFRGMGAGLRRSWDVRETDDALHLRIDMPGLSKEDVKVRMQENTLVIRGEGKEGEDEEKRRYSSRIDLPERIYKTDGIKAEMFNGVLKITVPKLKEEERADVINIAVE